MTSKMKTIVGLGIIIIILVVVLAVYYQMQIDDRNENEISQTLSPQSIKVEIPQATASPDAAVSAIIQSIDSESLMVSEENEESSLIGADSQAINAFGQSYDEKEF